MPVYHQEPDNNSPESIQRQPYQSLGCDLLHRGPITLYCHKRLLDEDLETLASENFQVRRLCARRWGRRKSMLGNLHSPYDDLKEALDFPAHYATNINAVDEALCELDLPDTGGMAIVLEDFDLYVRLRRKDAKLLLDVLVGSSRLLQVFGKTLLVLIHSADPHIDIGPVGAIEPSWNDREGVGSMRGVYTPRPD